VEVWYESRSTNLQEPSFFSSLPNWKILQGKQNDMAGVASKVKTRHHNHTPGVVSREDKSIKALIVTTKTFTDPFANESSEL